MVPIQLSDTFVAIASQRLCAKRDLMTGFASDPGRTKILDRFMRKSRHSRGAIAPEPLPTSPSNR